MFSPQAAKRLKEKFSLVSKSHKSTRGAQQWLKKFDFREVLRQWLRVQVPQPPIGSVEMFRANVQFMIENYERLVS